MDKRLKPMHEHESKRLIKKTTRGIADFMKRRLSPVPVNSVCNARLWIPFEDKEMFAIALTAQLNKMEIEAYYDTEQTVKSFPGYGSSSPCRVIAINLKYVP